MSARPERPIDGVRAMLLSLLGGPDASIAHRRAQAAVFAAGQPPPPPGLRVAAGALAGRPVETLEREPGGGPNVFLHLHGGGYVMGDPAGSRGLTTALALATAARVVSLDYRLAPDHPFPAAVEDAVAAYRALLADGAEPARIAIGGESAGGGLAIAALIAIRDAGLPAPAAAVALSPWVDLACTGGSYETRAGADPLLTRRILLEMADQYLQGQDPAAPLASPLAADLSGLPRLLVQAGSDEVLLDDAVTLAQRAEAAGVSVELEVWPDMIHVWQMFGGALPEADEAVARIAAFLARAWPPP
ncbi:MAG: alpha/beta hydrolase [Phenylobacterium sp.]|uniref:alpha/beta hydrolase n=1 Tax=Phenylobacterium sp. TaxID=1871053 RepID=UPI001A43126F|nr:alpha/beta hydrolase [Phenylobacterium sp.]MBL8773557.1 alpha/beta hydrolase [Phenylobacterium sp.]